MKWFVVGAGVLLILVGGFAIIEGSSIIQVERGWASVIAGSVFVAAGAILLGLAAIIAYLEIVAAAYLGARAQAEAPVLEEAKPSRGREPALDAAAPKAATEEPVAAEGAAKLLSGLFRRFAAAPAAPSDEAAPPPPRQVQVKPLPTLGDTPAAPEAPAVTMPKLALELPKAEEPEKATGLRDFKFIFPPIDLPPSLNKPVVEPVVETPDFTAPDVAPAPSELKHPPRRAIQLPWLGRGKKAPEPAPVRVELPQPAAPAPEAPVVEPKPEPVQTPAQASVPVEPPAKVSAPSQPDKAPEPFSTDWLERALAADVVATPEAQPRFVIPSTTQDKADAQVQAKSEIPAALVPEGAVEIGRYRANDVAYVMYSDGSIIAETSTGTYRFSSLAELKVFIENGA